MGKKRRLKNEIKTLWTRVNNLECENGNLTYDLSATLNSKQAWKLATEQKMEELEAQALQASRLVKQVEELEAEIYRIRQMAIEESDYYDLLRRTWERRWKESRTIAKGYSKRAQVAEEQRATARDAMRTLYQLVGEQSAEIVALKRRLEESENQRTVMGIDRQMTIARPQDELNAAKTQRDNLYALNESMRRHPSYVPTIEELLPNPDESSTPEGWELEDGDDGLPKPLTLVEAFKEAGIYRGSIDDDESTDNVRALHD